MMFGFAETPRRGIVGDGEWEEPSESLAKEFDLDLEKVGPRVGLGYDTLTVETKRLCSIQLVCDRF